MSATITVTLKDLDDIMLEEDLREAIRTRVQNAVNFEVQNLRPTLAVAIVREIRNESMSIAREVLKSDDMQEALKGIALGVGAAAVKKHIERITEELFADVRRVKEGL